MSDSWFIDPTDVVRLPLVLKGDHWIEVKRELSFAEEQALAGAMMGDLRATGVKGKGSQNGKAEVLDASMGFDLKRYQIERYATWIVAWSAKLPDGKAIEVSRDSIAILRPAVAAAIDVALDTHVEALEAEKKAPSGEPAVKSSSS